MPSRHNQKNSILALKATEIALAAPQVVAHRFGRMMTAGPVVSEQDQQEFMLMSTEKTAAFYESWNAMARQTMRANQEMSVALARSFWSSMFGGTPPVTAAALGMQNAALAIIGKGLAPVHRRTVANAKRLAQLKPK